MLHHLHTTDQIKLPSPLHQLFRGNSFVRERSGDIARARVLVGGVERIGGEGGWPVGQEGVLGGVDAGDVDVGLRGIDGEGIAA